MISLNLKQAVRSFARNTHFSNSDSNQNSSMPFAARSNFFKTMMPLVMPPVLCSFLCILMAGCYSAHRLENLGDKPALTPIKDPRKVDSYHPVTMPTPAPQQHERRVNSLWQSGATGFFKDQRAKNVGDILTIDVNIANDMLEFESKTTRKRENKQAANLAKFFGYEAKLGNIFPDEVDPSSLIDYANTPEFSGDGKTTRKEKMAFKIAATIVQILPNGNYVVSGRQEIRANFENRELLITGIVRPADITSVNSVSYDKIAEARISYGGRGQITDYQQPPIGTQILDHVMPF